MITPRLAVLDYIVQFKSAHDGNSPTVREIADELGINSTSAVHGYLLELQKSGLIEYGGEHKRRRICVVGGKWTGPTGYQAAS